MGGFTTFLYSLALIFFTSSTVVLSQENIEKCPQSTCNWIAIGKSFEFHQRLRPIYPRPQRIPGSGYIYKHASLDGETIRIVGTVDTNAKFFEVNLKADGGDIPFHLKVEFNRKKGITMNSFRFGKWGKATKQTRPIPPQVARGQSFVLRLRPWKDHCTFQFDNGPSISFYYPQIPRTSIMINGQITLWHVESYAREFDIPVNVPLPRNRFNVGNSILIRGYPRDGHKFSISLINNKKKAVFGITIDASDKNNIKYEAIKDTVKSEKGPIPLQDKVEFELKIATNQAGLILFVDNHVFKRFPHATNHVETTYHSLKIDGDNLDVELTALEYCDNQAIGARIFYDDS